MKIDNRVLWRGLMDCKWTRLGFHTTTVKTLFLSSLISSITIFLFCAQALAGDAIETYWPLHSGDQKMFTYSGGTLAMTVSDYGYNQYKIQAESAEESVYEIHQTGSDKIQLILAKAGWITVSFDPDVVLFTESTLLNGGTTKTETTATQSYAGSYPATFTVTVGKPGSVTVAAGTFANCRSVTVSEVATVPGQGTVRASLLTATLAPGVGMIKKLVSPGVWAELVSGTVGGIDVKKTTIAPTIATNGSLPGATVGTAYNQVLTASDGARPYKWTLAAGSLPSGLTLSSGGVLSGIPGGTSAASFTVKVTGSNGLASTKVFNLSVASLSSLGITLSGSGSGSVNSNPAGLIACTWPPLTGTSTTTQSSGTALTLTATPGGDSTFAGWGGACSSCSGTSCQLTIDSNKTCSAAFDILPLVRIAGPSYFASVVNAYGALPDNAPATMQARNVELTGNVDLNRTIALTLQGGYGPGFSGLSGFTTIHGTLTVSQGSLLVERFIVR